MDNRAPRYRLQRREPYTMPNILGNHSMPVYTYRWRDITASDNLQALEDIMPPGDKYRIEDTQKEDRSNESNT